MRLDKDKIAALRNQIESALNDIEGVSFNVGTIRYNGENARFTVEMVAGRSRSEQDLDSTARALNLDLEKVAFIEGIGRCVLRGYSRRARKYPFIVEALDSGKQYKLPEMMARVSFGA